MKNEKSIEFEIEIVVHIWQICEVSKLCGVVINPQSFNTNVRMKIHLNRVFLLIEMFESIGIK